MKCNVFQQLKEQDKTLLLIKDQVSSQARSMSALNQLIHKKNAAIENLNRQVQIYKFLENFLFLKGINIFVLNLW
jgi:hypothetical protein